MPLINVTHLAELPKGDTGLQQSIVRVHNRHIDARREDKSRFNRREPVVIINKSNGERVVRYIMGSKGIPGITMASCALDYDALSTLGVRRDDESLNLEIQGANLVDIFSWFWKYPDLGIQLAFKLGILGAVLGLMGFIAEVVIPFIH